jgi:hypothetical protein
MARGERPGIEKPQGGSFVPSVASRRYHGQEYLAAIGKQFF